MRAAPALCIRIEASPATRRLISILAALAAAVSAGWMAQRVEASRAVAAAVAGCAALLAAVPALAGSRREAVTLTWDTRRWTLADSSGLASEGEIAVAIDLGVWLLLSFTPTLGSRRVRWLAVSRHGLETHWHALHCALHSPRPRAPGEARVAVQDATHDRA